MRKLSTIIFFSMILLFSALASGLSAAPVVWTSGDYEIGTGKDWFSIPELHTYNDVTVTMADGGGRHIQDVRQQFAYKVL